MARILVSVPEELLKQIDQVATEDYRSRSELLREGFRQYLRERQKEKESVK